MKTFVLWMILVLYFLFVLNYSLPCSHERRFKRNEYILISLFLKKKVLLTLIVRKLLCDVKKNSALEVEALLRSKPWIFTFIMNQCSQLLDQIEKIADNVQNGIFAKKPKWGLSTFETLYIFIHFPFINFHFIHFFF